MTEANLIADAGALARVLDRVGRARRIALDTEANGFHAYRPRLCLIQLGWESGPGREAVLIDPLAFSGEEEAIRDLRRVLADPPGPVVVHGGDYDVRLLKRDARIFPRWLFDTEIAARLTGRRRTGLSALVEEYTGERLSKSGQKTNWARRPLPPKALGYALADIQHLHVLHDRLSGELERLGRRAWADEEFAQLEKVEPALEPRADPETLARRVPGASQLDARGRAVLYGLLAWRDAEARRRDVPAVHILAPRALGRLAAERPPALEGLARCGVPSGAVRRYGATLLDVIRTAPPVMAARARRSEPPDRAVAQGALKQLKRVRDVAARRSGLDPGLVLSAACLRRIAALRPSDVEGLLRAGARRWQIDLVGGDALIAAARG